MSQLQTASLETLTERYSKDIMYDAHGTEVKASRSAAGAELRRRGNKSLRIIAEKMGLLLPAKHPLDEELFQAWIILLHDIITEHRLPRPPYSLGVKLAEQRKEEWVHYCFCNAN